MTLPADVARELASFPAELRKLVEAELKAGNAIVAIEHGFPAAPCGASIRLAQAVEAARRKSEGGVTYYARNNSDHAGEFTTELRHHFVLEPPLPPEPYPDMEAIQEAAEGQPDALTWFARTRAPGSPPEIPAEDLPKREVKPARATRRSLTSMETTTGVTRLLHFQDRRPPHEIQCELERDLMTLFTVAMVDGRLTMTAKARIVGAPYDFVLRFEEAMMLKNRYSLSVETSWSSQPTTHHDYCRRTAESWFSHWTREFTPVDPPAADAVSPARYDRICAASLNAEAHLDTVPAIQQTIVAEMKRGARFTTSHKEGGTHITWTGGRFVRSDYGDYPDQLNYTSETAFLDALRKFYGWETSKNSCSTEVSDLEAWRLILRLLRAR